MSVVALFLKKKRVAIMLGQFGGGFGHMGMQRNQVRDANNIFSSRRRHTICLSDWSSDVCSSDQIGISSRRRHTRCLSDWSSDVCSSDLYLLERLSFGFRHVCP